MIPPTDTQLRDYDLIDWNKPPPVLRRLVRTGRLTRQEASTLNRALRQNRTTLRWVLKEHAT